MTSDGKLRARAYQLEMFQESMERNIIVAMATGSGKTNVACLRIRAELERCPNKRVWFMAPNTVLAEQQLHFLSAQLPEYQMRTLLGHDKVDLWHSREIWDKALASINVVVSTPQVLLDALRNAFLKLEDISLLVFDEAHHCQAGTPYARIMHTQYHVLKHRDPSSVPHILGLTASSRISKKTASVAKLEANLDAECRIPRESVDEYLTHVYIPQIVPLPFVQDQPRISGILTTLGNIVAGVTIHDDPIYRLLENSTDPKLVRKFEKIKKKNGTTALLDLKMLYTNAQHIHLNVGSWAADTFVRSCVQNWHEGVLEQNIFHESPDMRSISWLDNLLAPLREASDALERPNHDQISGKSRALLTFLLEEYHEGIAVIIFVERRSTAFALTQLLMSAFETSRYRVFSFVGLASSRSASFVDLADRKMQEQAFADFRSGSQDICVATSVAEEGVDIQAVNLVIRYDDPKQFVSFLQSRGRARKQASKFVYFQDSASTINRYDEWSTFEVELKQEYQRSKELQCLAHATEGVEEISNEVYIVEATGAQLSFDNSMQHLQHFCAVVGKGEEPIYVFSGITGSAIGAIVYLPAQVALELREARSSRTWMSEKAAKRDAAFYAYRALHKAGLVNDNLVPIQAGKKLATKAKQETRTVEIDAEFDVWHHRLDREALWKYRLDIWCGSEKYESLIFAIPFELHQTVTFLLSESSTRHLVCQIVPLGCVKIMDLETLRDYTSTMIETAFRVGSFHESLAENNRLPLLLIPEHGIDPDFAILPLRRFLGAYNGATTQSLMIWRKAHASHFVWHRGDSRGDSFADELEVIRVSRLQVYTGVRASHAEKSPSTKKQRLTLEECFTRGAATICGPSILLLPSVVHFLAAALRAEHAVGTVLKTISLHDQSLVTQALLAKQASGLTNYERLEFLGDCYLKYRASLQMYHENPIATEGVLSHKMHALVSNARLEHAAEKVGLAQFITTRVAAQKHWKLPLIDGSNTDEERKVNSKLLADVVESILGAVLTDVESPVPTSERTTSLLQLMLPETQWTLPEAIVASTLTNHKPNTDGRMVAVVSTMFGYSFQHSTLLHEAFTHSSRIPAHRTLDRLEFLGDAILDFVLKTALCEHTDLDAGRMTDIRHCLAGHEFLAYLALGVSGECHYNNIETYGLDHVQVEARTKTSYATDLILIDNLDLRQDISKARSRYDVLKHDIKHSLSMKCFPWAKLSQIAAPKVCSDIIESLIAAIYFDSAGCIGRCHELLQTLGMLDLASTMAHSDDFEVRSPVALLHEFCSKRGWRVKIDIRTKTSSSGEEAFFGNVVLQSVASSEHREIAGDQGSTEESVEITTAEIVLQALSSDNSILVESAPLERTMDVEMSQPDAIAEEDENDIVMV